MSLLEVRSLSHSYGEVRAVQDVTFSLDAGKILGFIGPNGAGKSTTLRILATLETPHSGEVLLKGRSLVDEPAAARPLLGYMPDRYGIYEDATVGEVLDFFSRAYGLKGATRLQRMASVIEFTQLGDMVGRMANDLSKGMRQRVALARTLLHDPALLLLDEPADGLDPRARIELRELLQLLAQQGKAIIVSSHILSELSEFCDECAIIEQGRLLATGSVAQVLARSDPTPSAEFEVRFRASVTTVQVQQAERVLLEQPGVAGVILKGAAMEVRVAAASPGEERWEEELASRLLRALVKAELPVCAFQVRQRDLEDAFMSVTRGRLA